jgi:DNA-binding FadR family transcriptional regulator
MSRRGGAQDKLPHRLGAAIALDIAQRRLAPGSKIGSEPEFTERFGVSRAVFREAIRLLEGYGIVHARRGHGGGLVVGTPNPALTVSLVSNYLRHAGFERGHFVDLLGTLWIAASPLAAQRAGRDQREALLAQGLALDPRRPRTLADAMRAQFRELMQFAGNPALQLIGETVDGLAQLTSLEPAAGEAADRFKQLHCGVLAAVAGGDASLARRAMLHFMGEVAAFYGQQAARRP